MRSLPGWCGCWQKVLTDRGEDVDQHDLLIEHGRPMFAVRGKVQDIARSRETLLAFDGKADAALFDERDLLVRMGMHRCDGARRDPEAAHHQLVSPDDLPLDAF